MERIDESDTMLTYNRRAKLKRLTSDDRERMMRSRALPEDFDMTQALHSPFGSTHGLGTPLSSPGSYTPGFPESNMMRPLSIDTLRRGPMDSHISPTGISPAFGGFTFTPPQSATDTLSPVSGHEGSPFGFASAPLDSSPRTSNPFSMSMSGSPAYAAQHNIPRLSLHADRVARSRAESLSSPLRSSMSYTNGNDHNLNGSNDSGSHDGSSYGGDRGPSRSYSSSMMPYGIGYSCKCALCSLCFFANSYRYASARLSSIECSKNALFLQQRTKTHRTEYTLHTKSYFERASDSHVPYLCWLAVDNATKLLDASNECTSPHDCLPQLLPTQRFRT
jgi:hypothetical protein